MEEKDFLPEEGIIEERKEGFEIRHLLSFNSLISFLLILIFLNLSYLNYSNIKASSGEKTLNNKPVGKIKTQEKDYCPTSCVSKIEVSASPSPAKNNSTPSTSSSGVKEFYIALGSGSSSAGDWQDVPGLQTYINSASYPQIKTVSFEASVRVPTGNQTVEVRLFNETDKHPVWFSDVFYGGGASSQFLVSGPIKLDEGNKLYKIQMKTQLKFPAILDSSRIKITLY